MAGAKNCHRPKQYSSLCSILQSVFFSRSIQTHGFVVKVSNSESGHMGLIQQGAELLFRYKTTLCGV